MKTIILQKFCVVSKYWCPVKKVQSEKKQQNAEHCGICESQHRY